MTILTDLKDPRVANVTVTYVEVTGDLREAKVHVSIMGDEKKQELCMHGLRSSAGYLQQKVSNRVDLRYTPRLKFVMDAGVKNAAEVTRILGEVLPDDSNANADGDIAQQAGIQDDMPSEEQPETMDDFDGE